jgi:protein-ribulosamine 3-kinase
VNEVPFPVQLGVQKLLGSSSTLLKFSAVGGGCINHGGKLETSSGTFFLKWNDALKYRDMLALEVRGLNLLQSKQTIRIPSVIDSGEEDGFQFLLMRFIEQGRRSAHYWENFGSQLASLHSNSFNVYGLDHDNYIGSLHQANHTNASWTDFFIHNRLQAQLDLAASRTRVPSSVQKKFEKLFLKLPSLLPNEKPSLLHGDLWSGNILIDESGEPCLIDPATYYGHREVDLSMTQLFGGFDNQYFKAYQETWPLMPGFEERFDLYNLYPLLVHVNLFGPSYLGQVDSILNRFVS